MKKYFLAIITSSFVSFFFLSPAFAQTKETPDSVKFKTLGCLYRSIQSLNARNIRFQALQKELENMNPLMPQSMDSATLTKNLTSVNKYLSFLESHRAFLAKNNRIFSDSVKLLSALMAREEEKKSLTNFLHAYSEESEAFIRYSQKLTVMLNDIHTTLVFLQTVPMEIKDSVVTFNTDRSANEKFMDFQSKIAADQMEVDEAIDRSIKLTEKENKIITETTALLSK